MKIQDNISENSAGHLTFAGLDTVNLAQKYGTPLFLLDADRVRARCREYKEAMREYFGEDSLPLYASKALSFKGIYQIVKEERIGIDVVSVGEIYTALKAGFDPSLMFFHGNNKTDDDISFALDNNIGYIVCDCFNEVAAINKAASLRGIRQKILLRLSPGVDPHTHAKITTGLTDSKFGMSIEKGTAEKYAYMATKLEGIELMGFHSHIGSQITSCNPFCEEASRLIDFVLLMRDKYGFTTKILNLGGGMGIRYVMSDRTVNYADFIRTIAEVINEGCRKNNLPHMKILMEPGRSIVADAGMTLYTVGSFRDIPGCVSYTSIDGGMADNPRYALYESSYTVYSANRAAETPDTETTLAGRCCESGDLIQRNIKLPKPVRGDIVAVCCTGAYNYSMASNYNRLCRPPLVIIEGGKDRLGIRRESLDDLIKNDV